MVPQGYPSTAQPSQLGAIEHAARHVEQGADIEQPSVSWSQTRKRSGSQQFREQPFGCAAHSQREQRQVAWCLWGCKWKPRIPRTGMLCKLLALMVGLLVVFHAASCGYFFCVQFPGARVLDFSRDIYDDFRDIYALSGGPRNTIPEDVQPVRGYNLDVDQSPKLIPKIFHQTYMTTNVPPAVRPLMQSWRRFNPDWNFRFYDDEACLDFVKREFPEYLEAYKGLPKNVERSDFFRYMVVLRLGGVYADVDTECKSPLNDLILPRDTLVVSWENEFSTAEEAHQRKYVRKRQILQWTFAAAPGHPVLREICDRIARTVYEGFSEDTNLDTLERTGPGLWTDIVLKHARLHPLSKRDDPFNVRVMPKITFGAHPLGYDGLAADDPGIVVLHHFLGSWKMRSVGWRKNRENLASLIHNFFHPKQPPPPSSPVPVLEGMEEALPRDLAARQLYPVSICWDPPFTMLVDLVGHGDPQAGTDVAATLTAWGSWQPAMMPTRSPTVVDALVGSLGGHGADRRVLVDIGAGIGFFSLAAAARGHAALAFELAPNSVESLQASIDYNGFGKLVTVHQVAVGHEEQDICLDADPSQLEMSSREVDALRGYGHPDLHAALEGCQRMAQRKPAHSLIPPGVEVGAIRISATGWEGWVLEGLKELLKRSAPGVIIVELHPQAIEDTGYEGGALRLLQQVYDWGYTHVSHSGYVCDERWYNITRSIRLKGAMGLAAQEALKQPTWCRLPPESFATLVQRASPKFPENILFTHTSETPLIAVSERGLKHSNATLSSSSSDRAVNGSDVLQ